jgi:hypothetical protein
MEIIKMNNEVDQMSGAVRYYRAKVNGTFIGRQYLSEAEAIQNANRVCDENDVVTAVPVISSGQEILLG